MRPRDFLARLVLINKQAVGEVRRNDVSAYIMLTRKLISFNTSPVLPSRSMAGHQTLDLIIVVRIHGGQLGYVKL